MDVGTIGGRYQVGALLGAGGMAAVYRALDTETGVDVAIKVLDPKLATQEGPRRRFAGEARTMIGLDHPGVVKVLDVGETSDSSWLVMELVPGGSVADRMKRDGPFPPSRAAEILLDVLGALHVAHARGVVHRDVKPDNLLLDAAGHVKLTDFGIARAEDRTQSLTRTGSVLGTWAYMAPEQRTDAKSVDGRADLFSCGATLYALITGRPPMDLTTPEVRENLTRDGIPDGLAGVIRRATRYRAEDRYRSAHEMAEHLREMARSLEGLAARAPEAAAQGADGETFELGSLDAEGGPSQASLDRGAPSEAAEPGPPGGGRWLAALVAVPVVAVLAVVGWAALSRWTADPEPAPRGVRLDSRPTGVVMVDGVFKGATPWVVDGLAPGEHEVELRLRDGRSHRLQLRGGQDHVACWDFDLDAPCR